MERYKAWQGGHEMNMTNKKKWFFFANEYKKDTKHNFREVYSYLCS